MKIDSNDLIEKVLIDEESLNKKIRKLANTLNEQIYRSEFCK